jgi:hypothetical protein
MRKFYIFLTTILCLTSPARAAQNGVELNITISGKILIGINHRIRLSDQHIIRYGINMGYSGSPVGINLGLVQEFNKSQTWSPYIGVGIDALLPSVNGKRTIVPFLKGISGFAYSPQHNLSNQSELWLAYFLKSRTIQPIGISVIHFNSILD